MQLTFRFGFGIMDAEKIVSLARKWENIGEKTLCRVEGVNHGRVSSRSLKGDIDDNEVYELSFPSDCDITLEHVQVLVTVERPVVSPDGDLRTVVRHLSFPCCCPDRTCASTST